MARSDQTETWCETVVRVLKDNGVSLVTYVPDNVMAPLIRLVEADPFFTTICPAREEEALRRMKMDTSPPDEFDREVGRQEVRQLIKEDIKQEPAGWRNRLVTGQSPAQTHAEKIKAESDNAPTADNYKIAPRKSQSYVEQEELHKLVPPTNSIN